MCNLSMLHISADTIRIAQKKMATRPQVCHGRVYTQNCTNMIAHTTLSATPNRIKT